MLSVCVYVLNIIRKGQFLALFKHAKECGEELLVQCVCAQLTKERRK